MNNFTVIKYHSNYFDVWNNFIRNSKNATFLFHRNFMEYHADRFTDFSLMVFKKNTLVALLPANRNSHTVYSHQGLTYGGLVLKSDVKFNEVLEVFSSLLAFLNSENISHLEIKLMPLIYCDLPNDELSYLLFLLQAELVKKESLSVVNQRHKIAISNNRLEGVKRGVKHNLKVEESSDLDAFWNNILIPNLNRKHGALPVHSLDEIKQLHNHFPENIKQYNVYHEGALVAGTTMFITKNVAHCQYISGNLDKNTLGSLDFLFEKLINDVFVDKSFFDFGSSNANHGRAVNKGLQFWKEGFGARTVVQEVFSVKTANYKLLNSVMQ
ncbi:GNAT family N-acetyltransferase [Tamlana sp. 62-3]|uniref:GNAT family N-acetyltransferase n=1 Tax=Neotamlana sargassicola TaxID=2883125 RepID=A0A9X1I9M4_9FLAO|nr:GNAT family N-acetyltransferase [Tamlana sargassicola]MCB4808899.1 GNAT family N-acetyltransferase [Tamlana sargassicola]